MNDVGRSKQGEFVRHTMVAHWNEIHVRNIDVNQLRLVSHIADASTAVLRETAAQHILRAQSHGTKIS